MTRAVVARVCRRGPTVFTGSKIAEDRASRLKTEGLKRRRTAELPVSVSAVWLTVAAVVGSVTRRVPSGPGASRREHFGTATVGGGGGAVSRRTCLRDFARERSPPSKGTTGNAGTGTGGTDPFAGCRTNTLVYRDSRPLTGRDGDEKRDGCSVCVVERRTRRTNVVTCLSRRRRRRIEIFLITVAARRKRTRARAGSRLLSFYRSRSKRLRTVRDREISRNVPPPPPRTATRTF